LEGRPLILDHKGEVIRLGNSGTGNLHGSGLPFAFPSPAPKTEREYAEGCKTRYISRNGRGNPDPQDSGDVAAHRPARRSCPQVPRPRLGKIGLRADAERLHAIDQAGPGRHRESTQAVGGCSTAAAGGSCPTPPATCLTPAGNRASIDADPWTPSTLEPGDGPTRQPLSNKTRLAGRSESWRH
jgi:hypothetical protein